MLPLRDVRFVCDAKIPDVHELVVLRSQLLALLVYEHATHTFCSRQHRRYAHQGDIQESVQDTHQIHFTGGT